jgi:hypothetical protein
MNSYSLNHNKNIITSNSGKHFKRKPVARLIISREAKNLDSSCYQINKVSD